VLNRYTSMVARVESLPPFAALRGSATGEDG
jgi:hypothetical protein